MILYMEFLIECRSPVDYSPTAHGVRPSARTKGRLRAMAKRTMMTDPIQTHAGLARKENDWPCSLRASHSPAVAPAKGREQTSSALNLNASAKWPCSN